MTACLFALCLTPAAPVPTHLFPPAHPHHPRPRDVFRAAAPGGGYQWLEVKAVWRTPGWPRQVRVGPVGATDAAGDFILTAGEYRRLLADPDDLPEDLGGPPRR